MIQAAPTIVKPVTPFGGVVFACGVLPLPDYLTLNKEYEVTRFDPPSLAWIVDDEGDEIAIIIPEMHPEKFAGGHYAYWQGNA